MKEVSWNHCGNCGAVLVGQELKDIKDYFQRVEAGGTVPSGECPRCGSLCFPLDEPARVVPATFTSIWEEGECSTTCKVDVTTGVVFDIGDSGAGVNFSCLEREEVELLGMTALVEFDEDANDYRIAEQEDLAQLKALYGMSTKAHKPAEPSTTLLESLSVMDGLIKEGDPQAMSTHWLTNVAPYLSGETACRSLEDDVKQAAEVIAKRVGGMGFMKDDEPMGHTQAMEVAAAIIGFRNRHVALKAARKAEKSADNTLVAQLLDALEAAWEMCQISTDDDGNVVYWDSTGQAFEAGSDVEKIKAAIKAGNAITSKQRSA